MTYRPFTNCATDYGGPYLTIQGRGQRKPNGTCPFSFVYKPAAATWKWPPP